MNSKLFFLIGLITVSTVYCADSDYSFKDDMKRCVDTSDSLVEGSSENGGDCELYQGLVNISKKVETQLTVEQRTTFTTFIETCKTEVFSLTTMTSEEKFIEFSSRLSKFSMENVEIYGIIQYQNISKWSSVHTVEKVTIVKQQSLIQYTIEIDSEQSCPICKGLIEAAEMTGDANCVNDVKALVETEIMAIIKDSSISFEEKQIQIQESITSLFVTYTSFESYLQFTKIEGFGSFYQYFESVTTYKQVTEIDLLVTGTFPDIPIIQYLQAQLEVYKKKDIKIALQFNQFIQRVNQSFQQITDIKVRQQWFADYVQQWKVLNYNFCANYIFTIEFGEFGSCYDFCFCEGFEGPIIVTKPTVIVPTEVTDEVTDGFSTVSTSFYTEIPSTSSSCACVCE